jgi:hypothetical protein
MRRYAVIIALTLCAFGCATGVRPAAAPVIDDPEALREHAQAIVSRYATGVTAAGVQPPYVPRAVVRTTPGLIFFTRKDRTITLPLWPDVPPEARGIFARFAGGDPAEAEALFRILFNWYFIAHEASHWIRAEHGGPIDNYASEVEANDLAVAFWAADPANEERLAALETLLSEVVARVPDPTPAGMTQREYFNTRYDELGQDPMRYGYFQFRSCSTPCVAVRR